jgi:hypothetical protein
MGMKKVFIIREFRNISKKLPGLVSIMHICPVGGG